MMKTWKVVVLILGGIFGAIVTVYAVKIADRLLIAYREDRIEERGRRTLFLKTDYNDLRDACRELSSRVTAGRLKRGGYNLRSFHQATAPEAASFPKVILDLEPWRVEVDEDKVHIRLRYRTEEGYGVRTYKEYFDIQLTDGLWYYEYHNYPNDNPDPADKKELDVLVERGRQRQQSRQLPSPSRGTAPQ